MTVKSQAAARLLAFPSPVAGRPLRRQHGPAAVNSENEAFIVGKSPPGVVFLDSGGGEDHPSKNLAFFFWVSASS